MSQRGRHVLNRAWAGFNIDVCSCTKQRYHSTHHIPNTRPLTSQSHIKARTVHCHVNQHPRRQFSAAIRQCQSSSSTHDRPPILRPDNLFHSFSNSPISDIRRRAEFIKRNAYCPHPSHQLTRSSPTAQTADTVQLTSSSPGTLPPAHVKHECPHCGIPVACSEGHLIDDYESHLELCDLLRQINEDDHDLRSGRLFPEFEYPGSMIDEAQVNMMNWDTLLYSREFNAINQERSLRHATRLLTYPMSIGSVLHELSPYSISSGGRLTVEGLKSFSGTHVSFFVTSCTDKPSSPLHNAPTPLRRRSRHKGSPPESTPRTSLHPRCSRRIFSSTRSLDPTSSPLPARHHPSDLHRT